MTCAKGRAAYLDLLKAILTVGMLFVHLVQLTDSTPAPLAILASLYLNLITFSGFMLAFGIGIGLSQGSPATLGLRIATPALLYVAYSASSFAYITLVYNAAIGRKETFDVLGLRHLYGYSEFLASFFLLSLVTSFLRPILFRLSDNAFLLAVCIAVSVIASLIEPSTPDVPIIGTLIGSMNYATFPLIQYMPWFVLGVYYSRQESPVGWKTWSAAIVATGAFGYYVVSFHMFPQRFPPSFVWTFGSALPLLIYLQACRWITTLFAMPNWLLAPGRHVLLFLIASNAVFFVVVFVLGKQPSGLSQAVGGTLGLFVMILALSQLWERILQRRKDAVSIAHSA